MKTNVWLKALLILLVAIAGLYLFAMVWQVGMQFADILLIFFLAWLVAFILSPVAHLIGRYRHMPRVLAVSLVYLVLLLILIAAGILLLPPATSQLFQLGKSLPTYVEQAPEALDSAQQWLNNRNVPLDLSKIFEMPNLVQRAEAFGTALAQNALAIAQGVVSTVIGMVLILVLSFYIMLDGDRIASGFLKLLPQAYRDEAQFFLISIDRNFGGYLRGAVIVGVIYGIGTALVMWAQGLAFILPVSAFAGIMMIIPFIGTFLAIIPPIIIALFTGTLGQVLFVFIALLILQQIVLQVISPKVMSQSVGMHPLLVLAAVMVGAKLAGIWGVLFGVPIAAVFVSMATFLYKRANKKGAAS